MSGLGQRAIHTRIHRNENESSVRMDEAEAARG